MKFIFGVFILVSALNAFAANRTEEFRYISDQPDSKGYRKIARSKQIFTPGETVDLWTRNKDGSTLWVRAVVERVNSSGPVFNAVSEVLVPAGEGKAGVAPNFHPNSEMQNGHRVAGGSDSVGSANEEHSRSKPGQVTAADIKDSGSGHDFSDSTKSAGVGALAYGVSQMLIRHFVYTHADRQELKAYSDLIQRNNERMALHRAEIQAALSEGSKVALDATSRSSQTDKALLDVNQFLDLHGNDRYVWKSPTGRFRDELEEIRFSLNIVKTPVHKRQQAANLARNLTEMADRAYVNHEYGQAYFFADGARAMADIALGWDDVSSFIRALYEFPTGKNLFTDQELSALDRTMSGIDLGLGFGAQATKSVRMSGELLKLSDDALKAEKVAQMYKRLVNSRLARSEGLAEISKKIKWTMEKYPDLIQNAEAFEEIAGLAHDTYGLVDKVIESSEVHFGKKFLQAPEASKVSFKIRSNFDKKIVRKVVLLPGQYVYQLQSQSQARETEIFGIVTGKSVDAVEQIKFQIEQHPSKPVVKIFQIKEPTAVYTGTTLNGRGVEFYIPFDIGKDFPLILREMGEYYLY